MVSDGALLQAAVRMVQIPGESGREQQAVEFLAQTARDWGLNDIRYTPEGALLITVDSGKPGPTLLSAGHVDTVAPGAVEQWVFPPYGGVVHDGRLYGRGSSDMRCALTAMVAAAADLAETGAVRNGRVVVAATVCEELLEGVVLAKITAELQPDLVIIGEASGLQLNIGQRGRAEIEIVVHGQAAHSAHPERGVNAATHMAALLTELERIPPGRDPLLGDAISVVTELVSEPLPGRSVVPWRCRAVIDRRLLPGETPERVLAGYRETAARFGGEYGVPSVEVSLRTNSIYSWNETLLEARAFYPAWKEDAGSPLVSCALAALEANGFSGTPGSYAFCTDGSGVAPLGIPVLGFGPSSEELAHITDEYIEISQLHRAHEGYRVLIEALLADELLFASGAVR